MVNERMMQQMIGFLIKLRRNQAGNTIAMMGAALIPMMIMIGSGVDVSRGYMVRARLQQACDAGVLAGRKAVGTGTFTTAASDRAKAFFANNFPTGYQGTTSTVFTPSSPDNGTNVEGVATTTLPTVIMGLFATKTGDSTAVQNSKTRLRTIHTTTGGTNPTSTAKDSKIMSAQSINLSVSCNAKLEVSNADVALVLDTTGSMACANDSDTATCNSYYSANGVFNNTTGFASAPHATSGGVDISRMAALRTAVQNFHTTLTNAAAGTSSRMRYALIPFTSTVNVGKLLYAKNPAYLTGTTGDTNWTYQSRLPRYQKTVQAPDITSASAYTALQVANTTNPNTNVETPVSGPTSGTSPASGSNTALEQYGVALTGPNCTKFGANQAFSQASPAATYTVAATSSSGSASAPVYTATGTATNTSTTSAETVGSQTVSVSGNVTTYSTPYTSTKTFYADQNYNKVVTTPQFAISYSFKSYNGSTTPSVSTTAKTCIRNKVTTTQPSSTQTWVVHLKTTTSVQTLVRYYQYTVTRPAPVITYTYLPSDGPFYDYLYQPVSLNVSQYVSGVATPNPTTDAGGNSTWAGCIEERSTSTAAAFSYDPASNAITPSAAVDLDIDLAPSSAANRWHPMWPETSYYRWDGTGAFTTSNQSNGAKAQISCPAQAQLLSTMTSAQMTAYLATLTDGGGTHHDIGALWGARLMSETGIFASNVNAAPSNGGFVSRHMIIFTDGMMGVGLYDYASHGLEYADKRVTGDGIQTSTQSGASNSQRDRHVSRFLAICDAIKDRGIRLWVVVLGAGIDSDMATCASPSSTFQATNTATLNTTFTNIAQSIAALRISR